ncbi:hypothetical protein HHX47_DHR1000903 [Lentinula edodes]|nr:hypothetical protein HHX47_DHR1000903 [Lentinula edodes]
MLKVTPFAVLRPVQYIPSVSPPTSLNFFGESTLSQMPPKRKAVEASTNPVSARATRSSTRTSASTQAEEKPASKAKEAKPKTTKSSRLLVLQTFPRELVSDRRNIYSKSKKTKDGSESDKDSEPPAKRPKTTKTKTAPKTTKSATSTIAKHSSKPAHSNKSRLDSETYAPARALALFQKYADADDCSVIGPAGLEELCNEAKIPMDGAMPLILAWQLDAKEMGTFTKDEWLKGTAKLRISTLPSLVIALSELDDLLISDKSPVKSNPKTDPYDRGTYLNYAKNVKDAYQKLYIFCFSLAKPEQSRNIDMEVSSSFLPLLCCSFTNGILSHGKTSTALWSVILAPKYPIMQEVLEFIAMLEFCETVKVDLQDYESDGAWPTLLDDFVMWKKARST